LRHRGWEAISSPAIGYELGSSQAEITSSMHNGRDNELLLL